jgi:hypothetical protein
MEAQLLLKTDRGYVLTIDNARSLLDDMINLGDNDFSGRWYGFHYI